MMSSFIKRVSQLIKEGDAFLKVKKPGDFPPKARELLGMARLHEGFDHRELLRNSFSLKVEQNFKRLEFSDLPLTIGRGEHCFVDVYLWRRRPTTVHNHHFTGAFQCLSGVNVETLYSWKTTRKLTRFHSLGKLEELTTNVLKSGDVQSITLQDRFIHQTHHHADLTVNLCFRTPDIPGKNLANFLFSGLRIEKDSESLRTAEVLYKYSGIDTLRPGDLALANEDVLNFLLHTLGTSKNPRLLRLQRELERKMKIELGIEVSKLLREHDKILDELQLQYS